NDRAELAAVLRLLAERKSLREKLLQDVSDAGAGSATARGLSACILEDKGTYDAVLKDENIDAKIALFACGRLIRASLPLEKVATDLKSANANLKNAAELYLESEDSPEARAVVLGLHPGEAKVMGARMFFKGKGESLGWNPEMVSLFTSVSGNTA